MVKDQWLFGQTGNSDTVHFAVLNDEGGLVARCDKRRGLIQAEGATIQDIGCSKCQRYADYKKAMAELEKPDPSTENVPEEKPAEQDTPEPAPDENPDKPDVATLILDQLDTMTKSIKSLGKRIDHLESPPEDPPKDDRPIKEEDYKVFLKEGEKPEEEEEVTGKQFDKERTGEKLYSIIHLASNGAVFTRVSENVIDTALKYLNNLKVKWTKKSDPVPEDFFPACATAFKAACSSHGVKIDVKEDPDKKDKPARTIKRRGTRTIKRRTQKPEETKHIQTGVDEFGFRLDTYRSVLGSMLKQGSHFHDILDEMKNGFGYTSKIATGKLRGVIRKLIKTGHPVMCIQQAEKEMDYYHIVEDIE